EMARMAPIERSRLATCIRGMEVSSGDLSLAMGLVGLDIVARLAPHAPNVTPIAASALFAGMVLRSRALALAVPLAAMLVSDLVVGAYDWRVMSVVYAGLALPAVLGMWGRARSAVLLPPLVLSSSLFFFATTNFAVWASSGMYAHDLHGLIHCYVAALPFLQNTVIGDMSWATLLFGSWWSAKFLFAPKMNSVWAANSVCSLSHSSRTGDFSRWKLIACSSRCLQPWRRNSSSVCADGSAKPDCGIRLATDTPSRSSLTAISAALITTVTPLTIGAPSTLASGSLPNNIIGMPPVGTMTSAPPSMRRRASRSKMACSSNSFAGDVKASM